MAAPLPRWFLALMAFALIAVAPLRAGQQLVQQELFTGLGLRNAANPGELGAVTGTFNQRPIGPRVASAAAPGWSAQVRSADAFHVIDLQTGPAATAQQTGLFGAWYFFADVSTDGVNEVQLISLQNLAGSGNNPVATATINPELAISLSFYNAPKQAAVATIPRNTWVWIGLKWRQSNVDEYRYDATWLWKKAGQPMAVLGTPITSTSMGAALQKIVAGALKTGGNAATLARYGAPSLFALDAYADAAYPLSLIEPPTTRQRWYVNTATGDDANTGLTPKTAWRSAEKISDESQNLGLLPHSGGTSHGDMLIIDTRTAPLVLGDQSLTLATDGLTIRPAPGQRTITVQAEKEISASSWSATPSRAGVYQTSDTGTDIVLWESDRWLNHPTGSTFSDVAAALTSTPGSFWTDGTTLYLHPFENGNPASNGEIYTRSRFRGNGDSAVLISGNSWSITGLRVGKTCLARRTDNDPYVAYCLQQADGSQGGACTVKNCTFRYSSKHFVGFTADSTDSTIVVDHVSGEQASPYVGLGGQTSFVSYMDAGSGNIHRYQYCTTIANAGLIGSTAGAANSNYPSFVTHGPANAYAALVISHCNWAGGAFDDQGTVASGGLRISGSQLGETLLQSPNASVKTSTIRNGCEITGGGTLSGCKLTSSINYFTRFPDALAGRVVIQDCVIDLRQNPTGVGARYAFWQRADALTLTFQRNTFRVPPKSDLTLISDLESSDTLRFSANTYQLGAGKWLMNQYAGQDRTFAQWRKLGFDQGSILLPTP